MVLEIIHLLISTIRLSQVTYRFQQYMPVYLVFDHFFFSLLFLHRARIHVLFDLLISILILFINRRLFISRL